MNYPIPKRIQPVYQYNEFERHNEFQISGSVICTCGCDTFAVLYFGKRSALPLWPEIVKENHENRKRIVVIAVCRNCGKRICLYDSAFDGLTGYTNNYGFILPANKLKSFCCRKCGNDEQLIKIQYRSNGKADCHKLAGAEEWTELFTDISIYSFCRHCGKSEVLLREKA